MAEQVSAQASPLGGALVSGRQMADEELTKALVKLASQIASREECTRLAAELGCNFEDIVRWSKSKDDIYNIALDVLSKWKTSSKW